MTTNSVNPTNRIADHLGNGKATIEPAARESYVGKIVFVESPIAIFSSGEYIIVEQTNNALYGVKLGLAYEGSEVRQIPLTGKVPWTVVRSEWDVTGLTKSTVLLLQDFAATPVEERCDLEDCIYEGAEYTAGVLMRMLERRKRRYRALARKLGIVEKDNTNCCSEQVGDELCGDSGNSRTDTPQIASNSDGPCLIVALGRYDGVDVTSIWLL